jgi:hypothetical protein
MHCQTTSVQLRFQCRMRNVAVVACRGVVDGASPAYNDQIARSPSAPYRTAPHGTTRYRNRRGRAGYKSFVYILDSNPTCSLPCRRITRAPLIPYPIPRTPRSALRARHTPSTRRERIDRRHLRYPEVSVKMRGFTSCSSAGDRGVSIDSTYVSARAANRQGEGGRGAGWEGRNKLEMKMMLAIDQSKD